jgi:hypothetical protein
MYNNFKKKTFICGINCKFQKMAKLDLSVVDIRSLIDKYSTDLKLLDYQASAIRSNIKVLEDMLDKGSPAKEKKERKAGRPAKKQKEVAEGAALEKVIKVAKAEKAEKPAGKKGPGRPRLIPLDEIKVDPNLPPLPKKPKAPKPEKAAKAPKEKGKRGRVPGFNRWEEGILHALREAKGPLKNDDFMETMRMVAERDKINEGTTQLKIRLNQALVKLGNKLRLLNKTPFEGKGFLYTLK